MSAECLDSDSRAFSISERSIFWVGTSIPGMTSDDLRTGMISLTGMCVRFFLPSVAFGTLICSLGDANSSRSVMSSALAMRSVFRMEGENLPFSNAHSCVTFMFALAASSFWRSPRAFRHVRTCSPMLNSGCDFISQILFFPVHTEIIPKNLRREYVNKQIKSKCEYCMKVYVFICWTTCHKNAIIHLV